ncbi:hypothetical protein A1O7_03165 [Cladophialophora yegresii CBS 114405]|uniref:Metallo-beta-lactamase domain-containing protein n=1 Tax=Cladophialophora yegresii CBS 114405 TaxID=1182544 RepID=W9W3U6_9EURO|nr:uncharacterized protein A1O7_03165 [Cladophialophora yegresii CBS 114405]EXJ62727.1 hypothetical protein A1O7_03165 [Cladophialophora yegresii CBS 114405]
MAAASINFPRSPSTIRVRMIDTTARMTVRAESFVEPVQPGHEILNLSAVAFLLEHEPSGRKVMFDLGVRKDYWNYAAILQKRIGTVIPSLRVDKGVPEILEDKGIDLGSISSVIWSHYHWDHVGNMALFPTATEIVVGPGFKIAPQLLPGFPQKVDSPLLVSDFEGRELREIDFTKSNLQMGGFKAYDFFGDGSFYLLDTPGHCIGHMCGLARTTSANDGGTFLLLGGDICHFVGDIRPNVTYPLPDTIPADVLDHDPPYFPLPCPCSLFTDHHPQLSDDASSHERQRTPFYKVSTHSASAYVDPRAAQHSVDKLLDFEQSSNVMVCLAHDEALLKHLPALNENPGLDLNDWQSRGWKDKTRWDWLNELPRNGKPGRKSIVEGFWRDGKPWDRSKEQMQQKGEKAVEEAKQDKTQ